jgi:ATP-dependent DNA helicase RecG
MSVEPAQIGSIASTKESVTLEHKKSTAQLTSAAQTLCAFLNADGGEVIIGVAPEERIIKGLATRQFEENG